MGRLDRNRAESRAVHIEGAFDVPACQEVDAGLWGARLIASQEGDRRRSALDGALAPPHGRSGGRVPPPCRAYRGPRRRFARIRPRPRRRGAGCGGHRQRPKARSPRGRSTYRAHVATSWGSGQPPGRSSGAGAPPLSTGKRMVPVVGRQESAQTVPVVGNLSGGAPPGRRRGDCGDPRAHAPARESACSGGRTSRRPRRAQRRPHPEARGRRAVGQGDRVAAVGDPSGSQRQRH